MKNLEKPVTSDTSAVSLVLPYIKANTAVVTPPPAPPAGSTAESGAPPAPGSAAAPPPAGAPEPDGIKKLRETYETTKGQLEKYSQLGKLEEIQPRLTVAQNMWTEASKLGKGLGYDEGQISQAMQKDPVNTLVFLRTKQADAAAARGPATTPNVDELVKHAIDKEVGPVKDYLNNQMTDQANSLFETTFNDLQATAFPEEQSVPQDVRDLIYDYTSEAMKYDADALKRLKLERKTSDVKKYFDEAKERVLKVCRAYAEHEQKRAGGGPPPPPPGKPGTGTKLSLDDIISGSDAAVKALPSMRR